jgi:HTH-type transcriptional regulator / antitoxin HigA
MVPANEQIQKGEVMASLDFKAVSFAWSALVQQVGQLRLISSSSDYERTTVLLDALLDAVRGDDSSPLHSLVALVGDIVEAYEHRTLGEPQAPPADVLRLLMDANSLRQADLASELGGQSVVSEILNYRREINARQAGVLAARFGVSPAVFIVKPGPAVARSHANHAGPSNVRGQLRFSRRTSRFTRHNATIDQASHKLRLDLSSVIPSSSLPGAQSFVVPSQGA